MPIIEMSPIQNFEPTTDHNQAAEFSAWFLVKYPECHLKKWIYADHAEAAIIAEDPIWQGDTEGVCSGAISSESCEHEARAEKIATLMAHEAMNASAA